MNGLQLVFFGSIILASLSLLYIIGFIVAECASKKKKNQSKTENGSYWSAPSPNQAYERQEEQTTPANLEKIKSDTEKVFELVGVANHFNSLSVVDEILDGDLEGATRKIAQKLSMQNPTIIITRAAESKKTEDGKELVATVRVSGSDEAIFGTSSFDNQTINITAYPGFDAHPEKFIYVLAHELCHKILHSLDRARGHDDQDERETDIAAALLGFSKSYKVAKQIESGLGYLREDESIFLIDRCESLLKEIRDKRNKFYENYVLLRQRNDDKIIFLNNLYRAKKLWNNEGWSIDYSLVGEDYNQLIVCAHVLTTQKLARYWELCSFFSAMNKNLARYSFEVMNAEKYFNELTAIVNGVTLPNIDVITRLKKYQ